MSIKTVYITLQQFCEKNEQPRKILQEAGIEIQENRLGRRLKKEELPELLKDAQAIVAGVEPYDAQVLNALPQLRCISRCGIGTDAIDLAFAQKKGIQVLTTIEEVIEPVAQMTVGMILALARNLNHHVLDFKAGEWRKHTGHQLSEWTIGLFGFGRIGRAVERYLQPFESKILIHDPFLTSNDIPKRASLVDRDTLLSQSDLITLHASCRPEEGPLIGCKELAQMKSGSYLVNTARGYLIDEAALLSALESKHLAGAALDVFSEEPYHGSLTRLPQVLCTPHVATLTAFSRSAMELRAALNVVSFFKNGLAQ